MIVGCKKISKEIFEHCDTGKIVNYAMSLVPDCLKGNLFICNNQRYLVALHIRKSNLSYDVRLRLCRELLEGIRVTGEIDRIYDLDDIAQRVDLSKVKRSLKEEGIVI